MVVIEVSEQLELIPILMNINEEWIFSHMFPECSMVSFYFPIMFWCIWRVLFMLYSELHKKFCESLSKFTSTISTNHLYSCSIVWHSTQKVPNKLHTWSHTMFWVYPRNNKPTTIIKSIILNLWSYSSERKAYIELYFLPRYFQRISLETLSSHILSFSRIAYLISLKDSVYSRLINSLSCNTLYSPWKLTSSKEWHLTSKGTYFLFQIERSFVVYFKSHTSIWKSFWFWSWSNRDKSIFTIHSIPTYPFGYWLSWHSKALCYFCNRFLFLQDISYCLHLHSNILVTLESRSHRQRRIRGYIG